MNKIVRKCGAKVQTDSVELGLYERERERGFNCDGTPEFYTSLSIIGNLNIKC